VRVWILLVVGALVFGGTFYAMREIFKRRSGGGRVPVNERRMRITGIHHITLLVSNLDRSLAFYRNVLGMRLVEQTVNDDDGSARHFIFGDADGQPLVTCLEYPDLDEGKVGRGVHTSLRPRGRDGGGAGRLAGLPHGEGHPTTDVLDRTGTKSIYLRDPDGHIVEIAGLGRLRAA
jgi:glyoxalase family protein